MDRRRRKAKANCQEGLDYAVSGSLYPEQQREKIFQLILIHPSLIDVVLASLSHFSSVIYILSSVSVSDQPHLFFHSHQSYLLLGVICLSQSEDVILNNKIRTKVLYTVNVYCNLL